LKYVRMCLLTMTVVAAHLLAAQTSPEPSLARALALERDGRTAQAIAAAQALLDSHSLNEAGTGKAWNILGLAYQDQGSFTRAQHAYEQSIHTFERLPSNIRDYAMALDDLGGLYLAMGHPDSATAIKKKTFRLYKKVDDHAGMAIVSSDLAGLALGQKRIRAGRKYLEQALREVRLANHLDDDNLAAVSSMQGWLAELDRDVSLSLTTYQNSLDLWKRRHGEEHPSTGWGYILLGNAKAQGGQLVAGLADMQRGLSILERTLGRRNPRYMKAEMAYSRVLDRTEAHAEAGRVKVAAQQGLDAFYREQCLDCTISAVGFH